MVQQRGPGPWQTDDDQGFPYRGLPDKRTSLQILPNAQPVAEQPDALVMYGQTAEQVQLGRALIGIQQEPEGRPKRLVTPIRQAGASPRRRHEGGF
jgi:hypothetical protein